MRNKLKKGQTVWYKSFGKWERATISKIVPTDRKEVKLIPDYLKSRNKLVAVKAYNVKTVNPVK